MNTRDNKKPPAEVIDSLARNFELQLSEEAAKAYGDKDYIKSAAMSWSYIEEYYLPKTIKYVADNLKVPLPSDITKAPVGVIIKYYLLITHDKELYHKLEEARKLRNKITHEIYKSKDLSKIDSAYKESAKFNMALIVEMFDRELGEVPIPSLSIWQNARESLRNEQKQRLASILDGKDKKPL